MSNSKKYRERTIEYRQSGHTLEETHRTFKVSRSTIQKWEKQLKETGDLGKKELHRGFRKIDPEKLKAYVAEHPDAYQSEIAMLHSPAKNSMQLSAFAIFYSRAGTVRSQSAAIPHKSRLFQNFSYPSPTAPVQRFYAKDTSKKVRSVMKARGTSGKHMGKPPYGYCSDPQDKNHWILDKEAASVVKRISDLTIAGIGPSRIARILEADGVLTTKALYAQRKGKPAPERPCHWHEQSVVGILERMEYTGCVCNFKTYSKSYKLKKRIPNAKEDMFILPGTQEAIVSQEQWDRVQELRKNKRRIARGERQGLFSGLLFCADCGSKLNFATCKRFEGKQDRYVCAKYRSGRGACSGHIIREEVLWDVVLERIRAVTEMIRSDVEGFQEDWLQCRREGQEKSIREDKRRLTQAKKRLADIDVLMTRIYERCML